MKILRPFPVSNVSLISSTVSETDSSASGSYAAGTTYSAGTIIQVDNPTFTFTASGAILSATAHGWIDGDMVKVSSSGTLPSGLAESTLYYIVNADTNILKLSTTKNGAPIITTSVGTGTHTITVTSNKLYESLTGNNIGNTPHKSPTYWLDLGATNRWKCFDGSITSQTENASTMTYIIQTKGRIDGIALMHTSAAEVIISARNAFMAVGATTDTTGYAIGSTTITLASAGTGEIAVDNLVMFAGDITQYTVTAGNADVSGGGTISFTPGLVVAIPTSTTAITATVYGPNTYSLLSSTNITSYFTWFYEIITRDANFVDIDFPAYNNLELTITLNDTGRTVKLGALIVGLSKNLGGSQYGASTSIIDYSVKSTDEFGNKIILERAFADRGNFSVVLDSIAVDGVKQLLTQFRAIPAVYVGSTLYSSTIYYGFYKDFSVTIEGPSHSIVNIEVEGLT